MTPMSELEALRQNWTPPRELSRALPRDVQLSAGGIAMACCAVLLFAGGVAAYFAIYSAGVRQAQRQNLLDREGLNTDAVISRVWRRKDKESTPMVTYRFEHEGRIYESSTSVSRRAWLEMREGQPLPVRFAPSNPNLNQPRDWPPWRNPWWLPIAVAAGLAGCGVMLWVVVARQKRLLAEGRPVPAVVTHFTRGQHGSKWAHYEFAAGKERFKGAAGVSSKSSPDVGDTFCVLYHPEKPKLNGRYPLSLVKLG